MELEAFNIKFQHVSGKTNILADTLSRLVDIDPDARLDPETEDGNLATMCLKPYPSCPVKTQSKCVKFCQGIM